MKRFQGLAAGVLAIAGILSSCKTMEVPASVNAITVEGTLFYPDGEKMTYIVPAGAEIVGAGGKKCTYIVKEGGRVMAHSGEGNTFKIQKGAYFHGFDHPATNCTVIYDSGAIVTRKESGPGTSFVAR